MSTMHAYLLCLALLTALPCVAQDKPLTADEIMARVAANQDHDEIARTRYLYVQHARIASRKGKTVMCEETTDSRVIPGAQGSTKQLLTLDGRRLQDKHYVVYDHLRKQSDRPAQQSAASEAPAEAAPTTADDKEDTKADRAQKRLERRAERKVEDDNTDQDLVENLRSELTNEKAKNGLHAGLFPLSDKAQSQYRFQLKGRERRNGHDTFHITFTPRDKDDYGWRGDAWIDTEAFQPVVVQTALAKNIPFAVRTLLGTSLPGLGFTATYASQPDGVWFPATFGTEFKINVLFFFHRTITMSVENRDFQKTHVDSRIVGEATPAEPRP